MKQVRLNVDLIMVSEGPSALAAKEATTTIVMTNVGDPVAEGVIASLARPGGNDTGLSALSTELNTKRLEVLKNTVTKRYAHYVDKILKEAKPADLPVQQATKFEFAINLNTAKQSGVTIPQSMLYRAEKVIR